MNLEKYTIKQQGITQIHYWLKNICISFYASWMEGSHTVLVFNVLLRLDSLYNEMFFPLYYSVHYYFKLSFCIDHLYFVFQIAAVLLWWSSESYELYFIFLVILSLCNFHSIIFLGWGTPSTSQTCLPGLSAPALAPAPASAPSKLQSY